MPTRIVLKMQARANLTPETMTPMLRTFRE